MKKKISLTDSIIFAETTREILRIIPNIKSLYSITHASPTMHAVCAIDRKRIFTQVAISEILEKGIDILTPTPLIEVSIVPDSSKIAVFLVLRVLYYQLLNPKQVIELTLDQCKNLRQVEDVARWVVKYNKKTKTAIPSRSKPPPRESPYWSNRCSYHCMCLETLHDRFALCFPSEAYNRMTREMEMCLLARMPTKHNFPNLADFVMTIEVTPQGSVIGIKDGHRRYILTKGGWPKSLTKSEDAHSQAGRWHSLVECFTSR